MKIESTNIQYPKMSKVEIAEAAEIAEIAEVAEIHKRQIIHEQGWDEGNTLLTWV